MSLIGINRLLLTEDVFREKLIFLQVIVDLTPRLVPLLLRFFHAEICAERALSFH